MTAAELALQHIQHTLAPFMEQMRRQTAVFQTAMRPVIGLMQQSVRVEPAVTAYLNNRGWFVTMDFPVGWFVAIEKYRQNDKHDETDDVLCQFARQQVDDTEKRLGEHSPARTAILGEAFAAHREGWYAMSILGLLSQADGIGREILGVRRQFFNKKQRETALKGRLGEFEVFGRPYTPWGTLDKMLGQLDRPFSIEEDTDQRDARRETGDWVGPLNRHGVLHGRDLDYPSEANSLRCVLLLRYLLDADRILREIIPNRLAELNGIWETFGRTR